MSQDNQRMPLLSSKDTDTDGHTLRTGSGQEISTYSSLIESSSLNNTTNSNNNNKSNKSKKYNNFQSTNDPNNSTDSSNSNNSNNSSNALLTNRTNIGPSQRGQSLDNLGRHTGRQMNEDLGESGGSGHTAPRKNKIIYSHCHVQQESACGHENKGVDKSARRRLVAASIICLIFMIGEVVGGILSNSLAIATDAAHLLTDFASFMISLFAIWLSSRPATRNMSFGWYRAEVIGALLSVLMIWLVTGLLVYMAVERLRTQQFEIDSIAMVITASAGLLVNIIMAVALNVDGHGHSHGHFHSHGHGHSHGHTHNHGSEHFHQSSNGSGKTGGALQPDIEALGGDGIKNGPRNHQKTNEKGRGKSNINVRAAFIHVIGDFLQSFGVLIAALVIHFRPDYAIVDPICTFIFSVIVLVTTINIIRDAINVLMEGMPDGVNFIEVRESLQDLDSVIRVHNLRIWSLSMDKIAISAHLVIDARQTTSQVLKATVEMLKSHYNFFEVTIQVEEYKDDMRDCEHCLEEEVVMSTSNESPPEQPTTTV